MENTPQERPWLETSENEYNEIGEMGLCAWGSVTELTHDGYHFRFYQNTEISYGTTTGTYARRTGKGLTEYFTASRGAVIWNESRIEKRPNEDYFKELAQEIMTQDQGEGFEQSLEAQAAELEDHEQAKIHALVEFGNNTFEYALEHYEDVTLYQGIEKDYLQELLDNDLAELEQSSGNEQMIRFLSSYADAEYYGTFFGYSFNTFTFEDEPYVLVNLGR